MVLLSESTYLFIFLVSLLTSHSRTLKRCMEAAVCLFFHPSSSISIKRFSRLWSAPISNSGVFIPDWPDSPHLALLCLSSQTDCWEGSGGGPLHVDCWHLWTFGAWIPFNSWKTVSLRAERPWRHLCYQIFIYLFFLRWKKNHTCFIVSVFQKSVSGPLVETVDLLNPAVY